MTQPPDYGVKRLSAAEYQLLRLTKPYPGPIAAIRQVLNRQQQPIGWQLKPHVTMLGPKSKIWETPEEVIASTKLMTLRQAKACIARTTAASG